MKRMICLTFLLLTISGMTNAQTRSDFSSIDGLVINEFLASNVSTIPDQDGEYDDWVELYNNSTSSINLEGFNISDKPDNIDKWTFPDTTIAAGGYIVVWCDEDSSQAGLHANFKLSALGERILLSDPLLNIIDEITFGVQQSDTSTGRYPNGTGPFIIMRPTYGAENVNGFPTGIADPTGSSGSWLGQNFPNPCVVSTTFPVQLEENGPIKLEIHDMFGRTVATVFEGSPGPGRHEFSWERRQTAPGVYICTLTAGHAGKQIKVILE